MSVNNLKNPEKSIVNKKILVVGMQKSGIESALFLAKNKAVVTVTDLKNRESLAESIKKLEESGYNFNYEIGFHNEASFTNSGLIIVSPGVPADNPYLLKAKDCGVKIISEVELGALFSKAPYAAITGTNGKTTTTTLCYEILKSSEMFKNVYSGGNIGTPFISFAGDAAETDAIALEISSFQMEWAENFKPRAAALLNLTEDHLNRHHTMKNYMAMKMRVFMNQDKDCVAVLNADDPLVIAEKKLIKSNLKTFTITNNPDCDIFVEDNFLTLKDGGRHIKVINVEEIGIIGPHNLSNSAAACAVTYFGFKVPVEKISHTLRTFKGVHHRLEFVKKINGIDFYNDSKATNEDSAVVALKSFKTPVLLIAGGSDKGADFKAFAAQVKKSPVKKIYLIGQVADIIKKALEDSGFNESVKLKTVEECVANAFSDAVSGDTVLLSPACASLDMFKNYEQRGEFFINAVKNLEVI